MKYKHILISHSGGPEVLNLIEENIPEPPSLQVRIKIIAAGVSFADVLMREGVYMDMPEFPFTPGYDIVGIVDRVGDGVTSLKAGEMVAALTKTGGYSEYIILPENELVSVPNELDPAEAVSLVLNYLTAYQMLHRAVNIKEGNRILIQGAAGGVGSALLQLGKLKGLEMYGTASAEKHQLIRELGGIPIDYKNEDFVDSIKRLTNDGVDVAFDGIGNLGYRSYKTLRPNGKVILYGISSMLVKGRRNLGSLLETYMLFSIFLKNIIPDGKKVLLYQITAYKKQYPDWFKEDLEILFTLLKEKKIKPVIAERLPLVQAAYAHELLNNSAVSGKIVLLC